MDPNYGPKGLWPKKEGLPMQISKLLRTTQHMNKMASMHFVSLGGATMLSQQKSGLLRGTKKHSGAFLVHAFRIEQLCDGAAQLYSIRCGTEIHSFFWGGVWYCLAALLWCPAGILCHLCRERASDLLDHKSIFHPSIHRSIDPSIHRSDRILQVICFTVISCC
jgi:hypothetical protein